MALHDIRYKTQSHKMCIAACIDESVQSLLQSELDHLVPPHPPEEEEWTHRRRREDDLRAREEDDSFDLDIVRK